MAPTTASDRKTAIITGSTVRRQPLSSRQNKSKLVSRN